MLRPTAISLAALSIAGPALADVDPAAVWTDLQEALTGYGYEVATGDVAEGPGAVTVTDLRISQTTEAQTLNDRLEEVAQTTTVVFTLPTLAITEAGANAEIAFPPAMPMTVTTEAEGETATVRGTVTQEAMTTTVSEVADGLAYDYAAGALGFVLDGVEGPDAPQSAEATITIADVSGRSVATVADGARTVTQTQRAGAIEGAMRLAQGGEEGTVDLAIRGEGLSGEGGLTLPEGTTLAGLGDAGGDGLPEGVALDAALDMRPFEVTVSVDAPGQSFAYANESGGLAFEVALEDGRARQAITGRGGTIRLSGDQIPVPEVGLSLGGSEFTVDVPLTGDGTAQEFGLLLAISDLVIDDAVWSLFDAGGALDRGPASLRLDVGGTVVVPEAGAAGADGMPAGPEPRTLDLGGFDLTVLGATLGARGNLEIPEGGLSLMGGAPEVVGTIEIDATGLQGLLRDLVSAGLLPAEQAAFAGGMLGFMARPTGEDSFASEIVFGPDGSVTANGMPLR